MSLEDSYLITYFLRVLASINHHLEQDFIVCALEAVHCWSRFLKKYLLSVSFGRVRWSFFGRGLNAQPYK